MDHIGYGYGSEFHLLRYLGRHRNTLNEKINKVKGLEMIKEISWLDFNSKDNEKDYDFEVNYTSTPRLQVKLPDEEITGIGFCEAKESMYTYTSSWVKKKIDTDKSKLNIGPLKWEIYWPPSRNGKGIMNWDAVALIRKVEEKEEKTEWLLVEAKAHTGEIYSKCKAKELSSKKDSSQEDFSDDDTSSRKVIEKALKKTSEAFELEFNEKVWMKEYYQFANRLAVLHFLRENGIQANLLYIYFTGDLMKKDKFKELKDFSPANEDRWTDAIQKLHGAFELTDDKKRRDIGIYELFLPVIAQP
ncbi:MAG: hypothetical protein AB9903_27925 [Vulcanimicrobiota bacterium]